uniref:Uncharacterized protein n=1 Tax=Aegilops tauschii subsp. strangulata TaxID=200361 RepID=A0A453C6K6_AEGTS
RLDTCICRRLISSYSNQSSLARTRAFPEFLSPLGS